VQAVAEKRLAGALPAWEYAALLEAWSQETLAYLTNGADLLQTAARFWQRAAANVSEREQERTREKKDDAGTPVEP